MFCRKVYSIKGSDPLSEVHATTLKEIYLDPSGFHSQIKNQVLIQKRHGSSIVSGLWLGVVGSG